MQSSLKSPSHERQGRWLSLRKRLEIAVRVGAAAATLVSVAACGSQEDARPSEAGPTTPVAEDTNELPITEDNSENESIESKLDAAETWFTDPENIEKIRRATQPAFGSDGARLDVSAFWPGYYPQTLEDLDNPAFIDNGYWSNSGVGIGLDTESLVNNSNLSRFIQAAKGDQAQLDYFLNERCITTNEAEAQIVFAETMRELFRAAANGEKDGYYKDHFNFYTEWLDNSIQILRSYIEAQSQNPSCDNPPTVGEVASMTTPPLMSGWDHELLARWQKPNESDVPNRDWAEWNFGYFPDYASAASDTDNFTLLRQAYQKIPQAEIESGAPFGQTAIYKGITPSNDVFKNQDIKELILDGTIIFIAGGPLDTYGTKVGTTQVDGNYVVEVTALDLKNFLNSYDIEGREKKAALLMAATQLYPASLSRL